MPSPPRGTGRSRPSCPVLEAALHGNKTPQGRPHRCFDSHGKCVTLNNRLKVVSAFRSRTGRGTWGGSPVSILNKSKNLNGIINALRSCLLIPLPTIATPFPQPPSPPCSLSPQSQPREAALAAPGRGQDGLASDRPEPASVHLKRACGRVSHAGASRARSAHLANQHLPRQPVTGSAPSCAVSCTHRSRRGWSGGCRSSAPHISYRRYAAPCEC